ncbi:unnamed protein product [Psylliodes chrysocephalus]|uniref:Uncharacterized protein n=1 Tax=Psylliodes chrysocephalus TaxID=3402493 RepID=A0A9P0GEX7_9CUCU|nr:unnamed protein product [Psylliodes chrysocephala]
MYIDYCPSVIFAFLWHILCCDCQILTSPNFFKPRFITGTTNGIYVAVVFPIDLPGREAYLGWFFEAIHSLPSNQTEYAYPPEYQRKIEILDRKYVYDVVESKIKSKGFPGKACILRTICEVAMYSIQHSNGIFGDILHLLLSPSMSTNFDLPLDYLNAELFGKQNSNCEKYFKTCNISLLQLFSKLRV